MIEIDTKIDKARRILIMMKFSERPEEVQYTNPSELQNDCTYNMIRCLSKSQFSYANVYISIWYHCAFKEIYLF